MRASDSIGHELAALRDAVSCVIGFAELLAVDAGREQRAWADALDVNARAVLDGFARLDDALAAAGYAATGSRTDAGS